eukprot:698794_1
MSSIIDCEFAYPSFFLSFFLLTYAIHFWMKQCDIDWKQCVSLHTLTMNQMILMIGSRRIEHGLYDEEEESRAWNAVDRTGRRFRVRAFHDCTVQLLIHLDYIQLVHILICNKRRS